MQKSKIFFHIFALMAGMQLILYSLKQVLFLLVQRDNFSDRMVSMISMIILSVLFIIIMKRFNIQLSVFPSRFSKWYIVATSIVVIIYIITPSNYINGYHCFTVNLQQHCYTDI